MKTLKTKNNKTLRFYTTNEVFAKASKNRSFQVAYNEELARIQLAKQVKELRTKKRFTQKQVAKKANMPQSVIARLESGTHSISLETLSRIARVFDKEVQLV